MNTEVLHFVPTTLCTECFSNYGLRHEASALAETPVQGPCPSCNKVGGAVIDSSAAERLMHRFFVVGSIPPEVGGPAPVFQFNPHHKYGEVSFSTDLDGDLERLSSFLRVGLFHYGPPLWRIGYTTHYQALRGNLEDGTPTSGTEREQVWREILERCSVKVVGPETHQIFRVRRGDQMPAAVVSEFDTPPSGASTSGRYESPGLHIFYGAEDVETCLHESRVTLSDWIAVATFVPTKPLRLLDLSEDIDESGVSDPFERVDILMRRLAFAGKQDYDLCRELARQIHARGFDGFYFTSYFAQAHTRRLRNIALFGHPAADGKLVLRSVNRVHLVHVAYEYGFGPHNDTALPLHPDEMTALTQKMRQGSADFDETTKELDRLLSRRSTGPR